MRYSEVSDEAGTPTARGAVVVRRRCQACGIWDEEDNLRCQECGGSLVAAHHKLNVDQSGLVVCLGLLLVGMLFFGLLIVVAGDLDKDPTLFLFGIVCLGLGTPVALLGGSFLAWRWFQNREAVKRIEELDLGKLEEEEDESDEI